MFQRIKKAISGLMPKVGETAGCFFAIIIFVFCLLWMLAGFTSRPKAEGNVYVIDEANILSESTKAAIREIKFPEDIPAVIRTVQSIPKGKIGTFASDLMSDESYWQDVRPRGWLRRYIRQESPSGSGVYLLISLDPQLLQIRFGREIRLKAYQQGLAFGSWYRDKQLFKKDAINSHLLETVKDLAQRMQKVKYWPWPLGWAQRASSSVFSEIEFWLIPSNKLFFKAVLKNYIMLANGLGATGSTWRFVVYGISVIIFLWILVKKLLVNRLILPRIKSSGLRQTIKFLINVAILGAFLISFASLTALSKGRIEDELALKEQGLSFLSNVGFDATLFSTRGGLWFAIPAVIVILFSELIKLAEADQKDGELKFSFKRLIGWGFLLFFLPKALAIYALVLLILGAGIQIGQLVSENST